MIIRISYRLEEPYKYREDINQDLVFPINGKQTRAAFVNAFLNYRCPYSHYWCKEEDCPDKSRCFVPTELLDEKSKFSHLFFRCPKCDKDDNYLTKTPSHWVYCKKCLRQDKRSKDDYIVLDNSGDINECSTCQSSATLKSLNSWICNACFDLTTDLIRTYDYTGVGIDQKTMSSEMGILFNFPVLVPGYDMVQYLSTDNNYLSSFIESHQGKSIQIGGSRSRGFGRLNIISADIIDDLETIVTDTIYGITSVRVEDDKIGTFNKSDIKFSNGQLSEYNEKVNSIEFEKTDWKSVLSPGYILSLKNKVEINGEQQLFGNDANGFGAISELPKGE